MGFERKIIVIFGYGIKWRRWFLKEGYEHVRFIICERGKNYLFNPYEDWIEIVSLTDKELEAQLHPESPLLFKSTHCIEYKSSYVAKQQFMGIGFNTCLSLLKYFSALKIRCITPYGFYKKIFKLQREGKLPKHIFGLKEWRKI